MLLMYISLKKSAILFIGNMLAQSPRRTQRNTVRVRDNPVEIEEHEFSVLHSVQYSN